MYREKGQHIIELAKGLHGYPRSHGSLGTVIKGKNGLSSELVLNIHIRIMLLIYSDVAVST
jgi:hypothetical protein